MKPGTRQFKTPLRLPEVLLFQGFLKLKERGKLLPAWEELQSTETQKGAALHPEEPCCKGKFLHNERRCERSSLGQVPLFSSRIRRPNELRQISRPGVN